MKLRRERNLPPSLKREGKTTKDREVGVKPHTFQPAHPQVGQRVIALQEGELSFHGGAAPVEVTEALRVARDSREHPATDADGQDGLLPLHASKRAAKTTESVLTTARETTFPASLTIASAQEERAYGIEQGCTSAAHDPLRNAGRSTQAGSRSADPSDCGVCRQGSWAKSTPRFVKDS